MRISDWSSDVCSSDLLIVYHQFLRFHRTAGPIPAASKLSASASSLENRPAWSWPRETMIAPVRVARSIIALGLKRSRQYQIASARTRRPSASVLMTSIVWPALEVKTSPEIGRAACRERVCQLRVDLGGRRTIKQQINTGLAHSTIHIQHT